MAESQETSGSQTASPVREEDGEFEPTADMLVHEYDDEGTLDEEELMSNDSTDNNELDDLQKEGDMPLEALLAMYGYGAPDAAAADTHADSVGSSSEEEILSKRDLTLDKDEVARDILQSQPHEDSETSLDELMESVHPSNSLHLLSSFDTGNHRSDGGGYDEDVDDEDYIPGVEPESWKKNIQVGNEYQAVIPDLKHEATLTEDRGEETLGTMLWNPDSLEEPKVEGYLSDVQKILLSQTESNGHVNAAIYRDNEQALYTLLDHEFDTVTSLEHSLKHTPCPDTSSKNPLIAWSQEDCEAFESGLRLFGKNFFHIRLSKLPQRSVAELVQFYYFWKKTERRQAFCSVGRTEQKAEVRPGEPELADRLDNTEQPWEDNSSSYHKDSFKSSENEDGSSNLTNGLSENLPADGCPAHGHAVKRALDGEYEHLLAEKRAKVEGLSTYNGYTAQEIGN